MTTNVDAIAAIVRKMADGIQRVADETATPLTLLAGTPRKTTGTSYDWILKYADNESADFFAEEEALGAAGSAKWAQAAQPNEAGYLRSVIKITGHAIDASAGGYVDLVVEEAASALAAHQKKQERLYAAQLEAAIGKTGDVYGLTRSVYNLNSYVEAASTASKADLDALWNALRGGKVGADMGNMVWLCSVDVEQIFADAVVPQTGRAIVKNQEGVVELSNNPDGVVYKKRPFIPVPDLTPDVLLCVDPQHLVAAQTRIINIGEYAKVDDAHTWVITSANNLVHRAPRYAGKLTGVAAA